MKIKRDQIVGLFGLIFGVFIIYSGTKFPDSPLIGDVGPRIFPYIAGSICVLSSVALLLEKNSGTKQFLTKAQWLKLAGMFGAYIGFVVCIQVIGFALAAPLAMFLICTLMARGTKTPAWKRALYSVVVSAGVYLLFSLILHITLPKGMIFR